jgi:tRNA A-37 threonylcarbamoyl transferase component Bud32
MADETRLVGPSTIGGRYEIIDKLGAGACGTVYRARDALLGRTVAIKTIRMEWLEAAPDRAGEMRERFRREAQVAAQLKHPNILTIHDIGEFEGGSYIAMEFVEGLGLDRLIAQEGRLPVARLARIGAQVAEALDYAHTRKVVHRDVKPANVMLEAEDHVKVTDFGIAKPLDAAEHLTATGTLLGTPAYMSPEQARGEAIDGRSDLFAVGCILYEMASGVRAFGGESLTAILLKIATGEPRPLAELNPAVPEPLVAIIKRALAKTPEARYQTGKELARDLAALPVASGEAPVRDLAGISMAATLGAASPPVPAEPATELAARATAPRLSTASSPAAGPTVAPESAPVARADSVATPAAAARRGSGLGLKIAIAALIVLVAGVAMIAGLGYWLLSGGSPAETPTVADSPLASEGGDDKAAFAGEGQEGATPVDDGEVERAMAQLDGLLKAAGGEGAEVGAQSGDAGASSSVGSTDLQNLRPEEVMAMVGIGTLSTAEMAYKLHHERYGTLEELAASLTQIGADLGDMRIQGRTAEYEGYTYSVRLKPDGFEVRAEPRRPGLAVLVGDETGDVRRLAGGS